MQMIELPSHCDRAAAAALQYDFLAATGETQIGVDASKVERIGLAMVQLLISADRSGAGITVSNPSRSFCETLQMIGLEDVLISGDKL